MRYIEAILVTSHVDLHGDVFHPEGLAEFADSLNRMYLPMGVEHDPRIAPIGRVVSGKLVKLDDGAYAVKGICEVFEEGDEIKITDPSREVPIDIHDPNSLEVLYDRTYRDPESQEIIAEIASLFGSTPEERCKKSVEPLSILTIAGAFVAGAIASGFFNKLGSDAYDALKAGLKRLFGNKKQRAKDSLLVFQFTLPVHGAMMNAEVILTNPTSEDIEAFFQNGIKLLDQVTPGYSMSQNDLRRIVFEFSGGNLHLRFGVRKDAVPLFPGDKKG